MEKGFIIAEIISIPHLCPKQFQRGVSDFVTSLWLHPPLWCTLDLDQPSSCFQLSNCVFVKCWCIYFFQSVFFFFPSSKHSWKKGGCDVMMLCRGFNRVSFGGLGSFSVVVGVCKQNSNGCREYDSVFEPGFTVIVFNDCCSGWNNKATYSNPATIAQLWPQRWRIFVSYFIRTTDLCVWSVHPFLLLDRDPSDRLSRDIPECWAPSFWDQPVILPEPAWKGSSWNAGIWLIRFGIRVNIRRLVWILAQLSEIQEE